MNIRLGRIMVALNALGPVLVAFHVICVLRELFEPGIAMIHIKYAQS